MTLSKDELSANRKLKETLFITVCFFIIEFIILSFHELWRDEISPWCVTINSYSIGELFYNTRYEGFPKLWFIVLYIIQKFTHDIYYMQFTHLCIASLTIFVFNYFSPFKFFVNVLFIFGYFFAYEYSIISRYYSSEMLLLFLSTGLFIKYNGKYLITISFLFFILFQDSVYAIIVGLPFYGYIISRLYESKSLQKGGRLYISLLIILSGLIISLITMIPPVDGYFNPWNIEFNKEHFISVLNTIARGYFPLPLFIRNFRDTFIFDSLKNKVLIMSICSLITLLFITFMFLRNKKILLLFYTVTIGLLFFTYTKYFGYERHHGQVYIAFVLCSYILYSDFKAKNLNSRSGSKIIEAIQVFTIKYFLIFVLSIQFIAALVAINFEIKYPFSNAITVTKYLKSESLDNMPIVGSLWGAISVSGLLERPVYFPFSKKWQFYPVWDNSIKVVVTDKDLITQTDSISNQINSDILVLLTTDSLVIKPKNWNLIQFFEGAIVRDENFYIYKVAPQQSKY